MNPSIRQRRGALYALFFLPGVAMSSWVTRTPAIRDLIDASPAHMGLVLFGLSVGSMLGILGSGRLVSRFGARRVIAAGVSLLILGMPAIGAGALLGQGWLVACGLFLFGSGMGSAEVAMNVEGADIERITRRPFLSGLHGFFSLGTVIGAAAGIGFTAAAFPVPWHLGIVCLTSIAVFALAIRAIPDGTGQRASADAGAAAPRGRSLWLETRLLLIGLIVLAMALAEGAANDWLPLVMVDGHGFGAASGSLIYTAFALAMTAGRFGGGWFIARFGRARVFCASAVLGTLGLAAVIFLDHPVLAGSAVILWGLGASLAFPLAISAAGDSGPDAAGRVSVVATIGYIAFLVGPPVLGFVAEHSGLRGALIVPLVLVALAIFLSPAVGDQRRNRRRIEAEQGAGSCDR